MIIFNTSVSYFHKKIISIISKGLLNEETNQRVKVRYIESSIASPITNHAQTMVK
jgi:hypothetical protein